LFFLTSDNGLEFRLLSPRIDSFMAFLVVGSLSISHHIIAAGGKGFALHFDQAFFGFPIANSLCRKSFCRQIGLFVPLGPCGAFICISTIKSRVDNHSNAPQNTRPHYG
jgi:hypothetical protein